VTDRPPRVGGWRHAIVRNIAHPTPRSVILRLDLPDRIEHLPGQHYVIRLTAEDGYRAQRSYSVASAPSDPLLEFYIERLDDGEVSTFLAEGVEVGDRLEVRGPIGGWFVWAGDTTALGIAGGSGAVPFAAMLRHAIDLGRPERLRLVLSARTRSEVPYHDEFVAAGALIVLTRQDRAMGPAARVTAGEIARAVWPDGPCLVCGSSGFADAATDLLLASGVAATRIRVERFGPSGA
jgi:ferredoxin-NADP reductase